jgi:hypothetical protein
MVVPLYGQLKLVTATISGNITDATGVIVVGASVTAVNNGTGFRRQTTSNQLGQYNLPGLTPGSYTVSVEFSGFRRGELQNITLQVDQNARIDVALEVGQVAEITSSSAGVSTTSSLRTTRSLAGSRSRTRATTARAPSPGSATKTICGT